MSAHRSTLVDCNGSGERPAMTRCRYSIFDSDFEHRFHTDMETAKIRYRRFRSNDDAHRFIPFDPTGIPAFVFGRRSMGYDVTIDPGNRVVGANS